jgi:hypothetical protein
MAPTKSHHWEKWIEVGRNTFQLIYYVINVIPVLAAGLGLFFAYIKKFEWGIISIAIAVLYFAILYLYKQFLQEKEIALTNPKIWIDDDQMSVWVFKDKRVVKHQYRLRALREVERYVFKFLWSGSGAAKVSSDSSPDAVLVSIPGPSSIAWNWQRCALVFNKPMKKGEVKPVVLTYELLDENNRAFPFQTVSYAHVAGCTKLTMRLIFAAPSLPNTVYLTKFDRNWDIVERTAIPVGFESPEQGIREYTINVEPERGTRYRVEWQFNQ